MNRLYIFIMALAFATVAYVFATFPRTVYSPLEKRDLMRFPEFTPQALASGEFTRKVSAWFSDSEPFRDHLMAASRELKHAIRISLGEEQISFHASNHSATDDSEEAMDEKEGKKGDGLVEGYEGDEDGTAKIANAGILIVGSGDKVRALMAFGGSAKGGVAYANVANEYKKTFGSGVNVYCMVIPTAIEYYCPERARRRTQKQWRTINNIHSHLSPDVLAVDVYTSLGKHADEDIYLRTDHHWAPLGAFYAAKEFARVAQVPFRELDSYTRKVVHGFVGSMYGYSNDIAIKNAPEDFVYYVPKDIKYTVTYTNYTIDEDYHVTGIGKPYRGPFFYHYRDGSGGAYSTFMGSDAKITRIATPTKNGRRVLILKDSFGNALPGYLFFSFEEVHVVDTRYFTKNMVEYVHDNNITDILFANNIFNAYNPKFCRRYLKFLTQENQTVFHTHRRDSTSNASNRRDTLEISHKNVPNGDDVTNAAQKDEKVEDGVHVAPPVETVE